MCMARGLSRANRCKNDRWMEHWPFYAVKASGAFQRRLSDLDECCDYLAVVERQLFAQNLHCPTQRPQPGWPECLTHDADLPNSQLQAGFHQAAKHFACQARGFACGTVRKCNEEAGPFVDGGSAGRIALGEMGKHVAKEMWSG